jgi:hypothetical protein
MKEIQEILLKSRRTGNTHWILQSAIERPACIIVSRTIQQAKSLEDDYKCLLNESSLYKKLWWKIFGRKNPKFVSLSHDFDKNNLPVIFDNYALLV